MKHTPKKWHLKDIWVVHMVLWSKISICLHVDWLSIPVHGPQLIRGKYSRSGWSHLVAPDQSIFVIGSDLHSHRIEMCFQFLLILDLNLDWNGLKLNLFGIKSDSIWVQCSYPVPLHKFFNFQSWSTHRSGFSHTGRGREGQASSTDLSLLKCLLYHTC